MEGNMRHAPTEVPNESHRGFIKHRAPVIAQIIQKVSDFLQFLQLKYLIFGYQYVGRYVMSILFILLIIMLPSQFWGVLCLDLWDQVRANQMAFLCSAILGLGVTVYSMSKPLAVYLVDFACYKPHEEHGFSNVTLLHLARETGAFNERSLDFQRKICERSGVGDETYFPVSLISAKPKCDLTEASSETEAVMYGSLDNLFRKTKVQPKEIGILVVNCSIFNPIPSLSAKIVNHYKMRSSIKSINLSGMGCSAGLISIDLAKHLLQVHKNTYVLVVSTENLTCSCYMGNERSMLLSNCLFRMGGAAILLSNKTKDRWRAKYKLMHAVRIHEGSKDTAYTCVFQREDAEKKVGVALSKDLMCVAGDALKTNITTLGPLVLPIDEKLRFLASVAVRAITKSWKRKPYTPDFKRAIEHFCIHAGGRSVLDEVEKNMNLSEWDMEPSRMTLYRFGNTSSSSTWYELAYSEAKGRVKVGDRVWQMAFGSGFKCNSVVWRALRNVTEEQINPWSGIVDDFPVEVPTIRNL